MNAPLSMQPYLSPSLTPLVLHARVIANSGGGPDKTILRSAQRIDRKRLRMGALYIHPRQDAGIETIRKQAQAWDCPLWEIAESSAVDFDTVRAALHLCRQQRVTVWHAHDYKTDVLGLILKRLRPMKLVTTVHGFTRETLRTRLYYHLDNLVLRGYDQVIAVSPQLVQHCRAHGVAAERLSYIPNAIDLAEYDAPRNRQARREEFGIGPNRIVIGVVGRLSVEKGVDRAIRTVARLRAKYPAIELHIVGDGPQRGALEALARKLKVDDAVRFWGWRDKPLAHYEVMDLLLLPSHTEGLPNVVLEAMAMQVPVAATDVGGVRDLLNWGACGVVLDSDELTWPNHIAPLVVSVDRRDELARRARQRVEQHYTFERRMAKVVAVYEKVLSIPSQARPSLRKRRAA